MTIWPRENMGYQELELNIQNSECWRIDVWLIFWTGKNPTSDTSFAAKDGGELNPRWRFFILTGSGPIGKKTTCIWVNYNDLTATSLGIMVNKGNHPQMALIQVGEIL